MWENAFYIGGADDGVWETGIGTLGAAVCWELVRHQTIRRMQGRVQFAMTGTHWWTMPENWPITEPLLRAIGQYNRSEEHTSELQSLMRISYAVFCLKKKIKTE